MKKIAIGLLLALLTLGTANAQVQSPDAADVLKALAALSANQGSFWERYLLLL